MIKHFEGLHSQSNKFKKAHSSNSLEVRKRGSSHHPFKSKKPGHLGRDMIWCKRPGHRNYTVEDCAVKKKKRTVEARCKRNDSIDEGV